MKRIILTATSVLALGAGAALADGSVTVYTATPQNFIDALVPAFEAKTGTKVEIIKAGSGELLNRLTAEASAPVADVLWSVDGTVVDFNPALFEAYQATEADKLAEGMKQSDLWTPFTAVVTTFIVNESKLDGKPVPTSWEMLADPQYDDMISSARVDSSGSAYIQLATVLQVFGDEAKGWEVYKGGLERYLTWLSTAAPGLRMQTASECAGAIQRFSGVNVTRQSAADAWTLTLGNFTDEAWLLFRANEGVPGRVTGGQLTCLTGKLYLLKAENTVVTIERKEG